MLKYEFEKIAGIEVSEEDYKKIIEPMYLATDLDKFEFVKTLNLKRFALKTKKQLINQIKKLAKEFNQNAFFETDYELQKQIEKVLEEIRKRFDSKACIEKSMENAIFYYHTLLINDDKILIR